MSLFVRLGLGLLGLLLCTACGRATPMPPPTATSIPATATPMVRTLRAPTAVTPPPATGLLAQATPDEPLPAWEQYQAQLAQARQQPIPVLRLATGLSDEQQLAQELALQDPRFQTDLYAIAGGEILRNEIFGVYPIRAGDMVTATATCQPAACYRVELYNFAYNLTTIGLVDVQTQQVLAVLKSTKTQPDIPLHLRDLAIELAIHAPEVIAALGGQPAAAAALMASTKTTLSQTRCERSRHLCVAPTFISGERALWAIVDLTAGTLVGVRWTTVGTVPGPVLSEKQLQDEVVTQQFCDKVNTLARDGWQLDYVITSSDGLRIQNVRFDGQPRLDSVAVVDWHVSYSTRDDFGYSDAIGCPTFSQAVVVAFNGPTVEPIVEEGVTIGFALIQAFRSELWPQPCNYHYQNRYEFYNDGRFRPVMINLGRGCGNDGWYRPVLRMAFSGNQTIAGWTGNNWQLWQTEQWQAPTNLVNPDGAQVRINRADGQGFYLVPGRGQFGDGGRGDNPYLYATRRHPDRNEGDLDLMTIGSCCEVHHEQGPEKFIDTPPEPIVHTQVVLWYVAQMQNDDRPGQQTCWVETVVENGLYVPQSYPCAAGPLLLPISE